MIKGDINIYKFIFIEVKIGSFFDFFGKGFFLGEVIINNINSCGFSSVSLFV